MLRIENVASGYGSVEVLRGISLHIKEGEIVALIGPNGAGKSTSFRTISGLLPCKRGQKYFKDRDITHTQSAQLVKMGVVQVPEGRQILSPLTVWENLLLGAYSKYRKLGRSGRERLARIGVKLFPILEERKNQLAGTLSGGEQQMLAIARALMAEPQMLLLDEPSLGLAPMIIDHIYDALRELNKSGLGILLAEQNALAALEVAKRAYLLELGEIVLHGASHELVSDNRVKQVYLGGI